MRNSATIACIFFAVVIVLLSFGNERQVGNPRMAARARSLPLKLCPQSRRTRVYLIKDPNLINQAGDDKPKGPGEGLIGMGTDAENMEWDPENILGPREGGHIDRLQAQQVEEQNKAEYDRLVAQKMKEAEFARQRRENRTLPTDYTNLESVIEYFLDTHPEDMEHEIARLRPAISMDLILELDSVVNGTRLNIEPTQAELDRMYEYEALSQVLKEGIIMFDTMKAEALKAQENLKFLLTAKDKKEALLELAGKNEINDNFILLMESNAQAAQAAGQDKVADFIIALRDQATRYIIKPIEIPVRDSDLMPDENGPSPGA